MTRRPLVISASGRKGKRRSSGASDTRIEIVELRECRKLQGCSCCDKFFEWRILSEGHLIFCYVVDAVSTETFGVESPEEGCFQSKSLWSILYWEILVYAYAALFSERFQGYCMRVSKEKRKTKMRDTKLTQPRTKAVDSLLSSFSSARYLIIIFPPKEKANPRRGAWG